MSGTKPLVNTSQFIPVKCLEIKPCCCLFIRLLDESKDINWSLDIHSMSLHSIAMLVVRLRINFKLATLVHRFLHHATSQYMSSLLRPYTPTRQLRSASLSLLSQPRINISLASRHAGPFLWNSLAPSSSQIYRLLHCLQIQNNSPFLWCKQLWPLAFISTHFWFDIIMLIFASWNYIVLRRSALDPMVIHRSVG